MLIYWGFNHLNMVENLDSKFVGFDNRKVLFLLFVSIRMQNFILNIRAVDITNTKNYVKLEMDINNG